MDGGICVLEMVQVSRLWHLTAEQILNSYSTGILTLQQESKTKNALKPKYRIIRIL